MGAVKDGHRRSLAKAISWRALGSADTFAVSYVMTGNFSLAGSIASVETFTKVALYYLHERVWTSARALHPRELLGRVAARIGTLAEPVRRPAKLAAVAAFCILFAVVLRPLVGDRGPEHDGLPEPARVADARPAPPVDPAPTVLAEAASGPVDVLAPFPATAGAARTAADPAPTVQAQSVPSPVDLLAPVPAPGETRAAAREAATVDPAPHPMPVAVVAASPAAPREARTVDEFVGVWATDRSACTGATNRKGYLVTTIEPEGAWAGQTSCSFRSKQRLQDGWAIAAQCSRPGKSWAADVTLKLADNHLTWSSQRGSQTYVRCDRRLQTAEATIR